MKTKKRKRLLQKAVNHTNKSILRFDQLGMKRERKVAQGLRDDILIKAKKEGVKINQKGMPR